MLNVAFGDNKGRVTERRGEGRPLPFVLQSQAAS